MDFVIRPTDRALFKRCRRAWDLGARSRRNYEPARRRWSVDLDRAIHDALAVYYFPGMWDWDRTVVLPLVRKAFDRSMAGQRAGQALTAEQERDWERADDLGHRLLAAYFDWAPTVDHFAPVRIDTDVDVHIPDTTEPGFDLVTPDGGAIRFAERVDLVAIDDEDVYWVVRHQIRRADWDPIDMLLLDEQALSWCWAWELSYPGLVIAGTIYNELRLDVPPPPAGPQSAGRRGTVLQHDRTYVPPFGMSPPSYPDRIRQEGNEVFRRTQIVRERAELAGFGERIAREALDMTDPRLPLYPSPLPLHCSVCAYHAPCLAMSQSGDVEAALEQYRVRPPEPIEEGRLGGSTWSMNRGAAPLKFPKDKR